MTPEDRFEQLTPRTTPKHLGPAGYASKSHMRRGPISKRIRRVEILFVLCAVVSTSWAQIGHSRSSGNGVSPIFKSKPPVDLRGEPQSSIRSNHSAEIVTVPTFRRSFTADGVHYPYTMIGHEPRLGRTTNIPARILAVSLRLQNADLTTYTTVPVDEFAAIVLDSPNFQRSDYSSGPDLQYADAVQRAQFYSTMKQNWHTNLSPAVIVDHVVLDIPYVTTMNLNGHDVLVRTYHQGTAPDGNTFTLLLESFFDDQILKLVNVSINRGQYRTDALNIAIFPNTYLFEGVSAGRIVGCCVGGFHTYFTDKGTPERRWIFAFASYMSEGLFSGGVADVTALSHEISEAINDPFVNNRVPAWQFPGNTGSCQNDLETGDPLEAVENGVSIITLRTRGKPFAYHPQTQALWQWFAQGQHSDAIDGAYSYPDKSALVGPATPFPQKTCPLY